MTVYRSGASVGAGIAGRVYQSACFVGGKSLERVELEHTWGWIPPFRCQLMVNQAYSLAQVACTPPPGHSFVQRGRLYASKTDFADSLVAEFRKLVYARLDLLERGGG